MLSTSYACFSPAGQMSCSTFLLRQPQGALIGHNLDAPYHVPGVIVCNPRDIQKTSMSFFELVSAQKPPAPPLWWTSTFGSVTFNPMGCEFPDGGINEVGLYVQEMTLPGTRFPSDPQRPRMFMAQWIQYRWCMDEDLLPLMKAAKYLGISNVKLSRLRPSLCAWRHPDSSRWKRSCLLDCYFK